VSVRAQTGAVEASPPTGTAADLRVEPRYTVNYNSSGGGYDGFGGIEVFLPIEQEPGHSLSYVIGRLNLSNDADVGGNLQLGTRTLGNCWLIGGDCIFGGYFGVDFTNTGSVLFPQLGGGLEMLGDLDLRLNGYLPIGDTTRTVEEGSFVSATGSRFQGNSLVLLDANHAGLAEVALNGIDAEVGGKLVQFGNGGSLRGYGGFYNYGGEEVNRYWGGRFRLEVRPTPYLSLSGGVQFDDEFGTNFLFGIWASFPNIYQRREAEPAPIYARLSEPLGRLNSVVVAERAVPATEVAVDPTTGEDLNIVHVAPGRGNSNGTFEDPTSTIAAATEVATDETDIIYVQPGNAGGAFTIPDGVAVLSVAPVQVVDTQFGPVQLPGSGQGETARPVIELVDEDSNERLVAVRMGNDTTLSGFAIDYQIFSSSVGIRIEGSNNVTISNNLINPIGSGFLGFGVSTGVIASNSTNFSISNNTIPSGLSAISVINSRDFALLDNLAGRILVQESGSFAVANNVLNARASALIIDGSTDFAISDNSINGRDFCFRGFCSTTIGVNVRDSTNFNISNNVIDARSAVSLPDSAAIGVSISNSSDFTIFNNFIRANSTNETVTDRGGVIISGESNNSTIVDNIINTEGSFSDGISIQGRTNSDVIISNNRIEQAGRDGIRIELIQPTSSQCTALSNNLSQNFGTAGDGGFGYHLINAGNGIFQIVDASTTFADTQASNIGTFFFDPDISAFTNVPACPQN
jgi:hypothetical protein